MEAAVRILEDDPVFDAGTGSVLNDEGDVEMDSMIMDGRTLGRVVDNIGSFSTMCTGVWVYINQECHSCRH